MKAVWMVEQRVSDLQHDPCALHRGQAVALPCLRGWSAQPHACTGESADPGSWLPKKKGLWTMRGSFL